MKQISKYKTSKYLSVIFTIILLYSGALFAQESMSATKLTWESGIADQIEYNDNIFLEHDKIDDFINIITPRFDLIYNDQNPLWSVKGGYGIDIVNYIEYGENNYQKHTPYISSAFRTPANLYGSFDETYDNTADPYGTDEHYGEGRKTKRSSNKATITIGYEFFSHLAVEGFFNNRINWFSYEEDKWQNRNDNIFGSSLIYKLTPKTSMLFRYRITNSLYPEQRDGIDGWNSNTSEDTTKNEYMTGFSFDPRGKLSGALLLGYENQNYENDMSKNGYKYMDFSGWLAEVDLKFKASQKTEFNFKLERKIKSSGIIEASSQEDMSVALGYSQKLMHSFIFILAAGWDIWDYDLFNELALPEKKMVIYSAKTGVDYIIREWLSTGIMYEYKTKKATNDHYEDEEYNNSITAFAVKATF